MARKLLKPGETCAVLTWNDELGYRGEILEVNEVFPFGKVYKVKILTAELVGETVSIRHSLGVVIPWPAHDLFKGYRVRSHPATDAFMAGDVYGTVEKVGSKWIHVRMDRSKRLRKFNPANLIHHRPLFAGKVG